MHALRVTMSLWFAALAILPPVAGITRSLAAIGPEVGVRSPQNSPAESPPREWIEPTTGHRVIRLSDDRLAEIAIRGASAKAITATVLAAKDIHAHNSFAEPHSVQPMEMPVATQRGGSFVHEFSPASVTRLEIALE